MADDQRVARRKESNVLLALTVSCVVVTEKSTLAPIVPEPVKPNVSVPPTDRALIVIVPNAELSKMHSAACPTARSMIAERSTRLVFTFAPVQVMPVRTQPAGSADSLIL